MDRLMRTILNVIVIWVCSANLLLAAYVNDLIGMWALFYIYANIVLISVAWVIKEAIIKLSIMNRRRMKDTK